MPLVLVAACGSDLCTNDARFVVHWPGRRILMCPPCVAWARKIAAAMAFELSVDELPPPAPAELPS